MKPTIHKHSKFPCVKEEHEFHLLKEIDFKWTGHALWKCAYCKQIVEST